MSILYAISIVYIAAEYDGPGFCTPIGIILCPPRYSEYLNSSVLERFFSRGVVLNEQGV